MLQLTLPIDVSILPPELEDECIALQEEYDEERKENADLVRRKEEVTRNILSQKTDIDTLVETISSLEARVSSASLVHSDHSMSNTMTMMSHCA